MTNQEYWNTLATSLTLINTEFECMIGDVLELPSKFGGKIGTDFNAHSMMDLGTLEDMCMRSIGNAAVPPAYQAGLALAYLVALGHKTQSWEFHDSIEMIDHSGVARSFDTLKKLQVNRLIKSACQDFMAVIQGALPAMPHSDQFRFRSGLSQIDKVVVKESNLNLLTLPKR